MLSEMILRSKGKGRIIEPYWELGIPNERKEEEGT